MNASLSAWLQVMSRPDFGRLGSWRRILKNWPLRVLERLGLARGDLRYRMRNGLRITLRGGVEHSDALILWDIYINEPYTRGFAALADAAVIVDVGAHVGIFSTWAARQNPGARIYSYEAHPESFGYLDRNIRENRLEGVRPYHAAVAGAGGRLKLYLHHEGTGGNSLYASHVKDEEKRFLEVPAVTLDEIVAGHGLGAIDFLKLDCEGAEYEILLKASPETLGRVRKIVMELHAVPGYDPERLCEFLGRSGFRVKRVFQPSLLFASRD